VRLAIAHAMASFTNRRVVWLVARQEPDTDSWLPPPPLTISITIKLKLRGLSPHANYTDRAAAAGRRS